MTPRDRREDRLPPASEPPPTPPLPDGTPTGPGQLAWAAFYKAWMDGVQAVQDQARAEGAVAERRRIREVLAHPDSEWRFAGPALDYFADLMGGDGD